MDFELLEQQWLKEHAATSCLQDLSCHERPPLGGGITLNDCLEAFSQREMMQEDNMWLCPDCKKLQRATKQLQLWKLPQVILF